MKAVPTLFFAMLMTAPLLAQNYQYQYPNDPYSSAPQPQPQSKYGATTASANNYGFDKLLGYGSLSLNYSFLDFKHDSIFSGSNGLAAQLRVPLFKPLFLDFGLDWHTGTDSHHHSFNFTGISGAAGVFIPLGSRFHLFAEVGGRYYSPGGSLSTIETDDFSVFLRPGLRVAVTEKFELAGSVLFADAKNFNDRSVELNAYYALLSVLDLGFGMDFGSDANSYHAGLRLRW